MASTTNEQKNDLQRGKITDVKTILLTGPCSLDPYLLPCRAIRSAAFIEIHTKSGVVGYGETYAGYFVPEIVPAIVDYHKHILINQNILETKVQDIRERMEYCTGFWTRNGIGAAVLSGIEAALWDLKGKLLKVPVYQLLLKGKECKHEKLLCYATGGPSNYPPERLIEKMDHYMALGFLAFKIGAGYLADEATTTNGHQDDGSNGINVARSKSALTPDEIVNQEEDKWHMMREHCGPDIKIAMDAHMANRQPGSLPWTTETALKVCKAIEKYDPFFLEEPLPYENIESYSKLVQNTSVPIAGGECLTSVREFQNFAKLKAFDIAQPDAAFTNGLSTCVEVSEMFEKVAYHSWGAGGGLMQNIHAGFACTNTCVMELVPNPGPLHTEIYGSNSVLFEDGYLYPPTSHGLGLHISEEVKNKYQFVKGSGEFNDVTGKILDDSKLNVEWNGLLKFRKNGQPYLDNNQSDNNCTDEKDLQVIHSDSGIINVVLIAPSDYKLAALIQSSQKINEMNKNTGKQLIFHYPETHEELYDTLPIAEVCIWVWPPDAFKCEDIIWTDHTGAEKIMNRWNEVARNVKWVHITSHGIDHVPYKKFPKQLTVTNSKGAFGHQVAEFVLWGMLHWAKKGEEMRKAQSEKKWYCPVIKSLRGTTVGIIGYGSIGQNVAKMSSVMGMNICVLRRRKNQRKNGSKNGSNNGSKNGSKNGSDDSDDYGAEFVYGEKGLEQIMKESDYVVIAAPLTPATNGMVSKTQLDFMKPTSVLINVGRGEIVDENALITCLNERQILGAVLEVFSQEPLPENSPFWNMENVIVAAHCADNTADQLKYSLEILENNLMLYCEGGSKDLMNVVDRVEGY